ncbi:hypothetical protein EK0264_04365 [Epidermidibacterium keratini]|uniref:Uncharacterized protein n=1 Tax=Epidermidibacterium keratini TaxID=1891644 RepID=A0A7L4YL82_9ACTN|nr:hypothetical protein [Epidermidibacterium keratini]QHB99593.1 hypothetical protein EK0264_04365 [Epidermidibacterium keratini]
MTRLYFLVIAAVLSAHGRVRRTSERGDVPGWVMVVVMSAALVIAILIPFREAIVEAVQNALNSVTGQ